MECEHGKSKNMEVMEAGDQSKQQASEGGSPNIESNDEVIYSDDDISEEMQTFICTPFPYNRGYLKDSLDDSKK